jgi:hypothetical protein
VQLLQTVPNCTHCIAALHADGHGVLPLRGTDLSQLLLQGPLVRENPALAVAAVGVLAILVVVLAIRMV